MRALIIDDSTAIRLVLKKQLASIGFDTAGCEQASDGVEGLDVLKREGAVFDVIFVDLNMPNLDGIEFTRTVCAEEATQQIPIIVITGESERARAEEAVRLGATAFLFKPFTPRSIRKQLDAVFGDREGGWSTGPAAKQTSSGGGTSPTASPAADDARPQLPPRKTRVERVVDRGSPQRAGLNCELEIMPLSRLISLLHSAGRTGLLTVRKAADALPGQGIAHGLVYVVSGTVSYATVTVPGDVPESRGGEEAVRFMSEWRSGSAVFNAGEHDFKSNVKGQTAELLAAIR